MLYTESHIPSTMGTLCVTRTCIVWAVRATTSQLRLEVAEDADEKDIKKAYRTLENTKLYWVSRVF